MDSRCVDNFFDSSAGTKLAQSMLAGCALRSLCCEETICYSCDSQMNTLHVHPNHFHRDQSLFSLSAQALNNVLFVSVCGIT